MEINPEEILSLIKTTSNLPLVRVNREEYLKLEFEHLYPNLIDEILEKGPYEAGVSLEVINKKAYASINYETTKATGLSFIAGIPGGLAMIGTIPADLTQSMGHSIRIVQKLAYLSGMPGFSGGNMTDDEANMVLIYLCVMFGEVQATIALKQIAEHLAKIPLKQIPKIAITKVIGYSTIKSLLKILGIKLTKDVAAKSVSKVIPILGGVASGCITFATLKKMSNRLYDKLAESRFTNK